MSRRRFIARPPRTNRPHRVNRQIRISPVRVIDAEGKQLGVMSADEGRQVAREAGLDLVEMAPEARPPVCRVMDYGRYRYEQSKRKKAMKSQKNDLKTLQLRPRIEEHDLDTKLRKASGFLEEGHPVKVVMRMRGRERATIPRWMDRLRNIVGQLTQDESGRVKQAPRVEGRDLVAMVEPA